VNTFKNSGKSTPVPYLQNGSYNALSDKKFNRRVPSKNRANYTYENTREDRTNMLTRRSERSVSLPKNLPSSSKNTLYINQARGMRKARN